jgi:hypothetical protein
VYEDGFWNFTSVTSLSGQVLITLGFSLWGFLSVDRCATSVSGVQYTTLLVQLDGDDSVYEQIPETAALATAKQLPPPLTEQQQSLSSNTLKNQLYQLQKQLYRLQNELHQLQNSSPSFYNSSTSFRRSFTSSRNSNTSIRNSLTRSRKSSLNF